MEVAVVVVVDERPRLARMNNVVTSSHWPFPATHTHNVEPDAADICVVPGSTR